MEVQIEMRPLTSGVSRRLIADAFPETEPSPETALEVGWLPLNYVLIGLQI